MKTLNIIIILSGIYMLINAFGIVNIMVSERYELDEIDLVEYNEHATSHEKEIIKAEIKVKADFLKEKKTSCYVNITFCFILIVISIIGIDKIKNIK